MKNWKRSFPAKRYLSPKHLTSMNPPPFIAKGTPVVPGNIMESFALHDIAKSRDAFFHSAWVQDPLYRMRGDTRGLVVYMCDCLMIFLPFTSYVFVSCIMHYCVSHTPATRTASRRRFSSRISGTFHSTVKNCHRLRDFLLTTSSFAASESGLFSTSIDSLHVYSILRLNWVLSALESIEISASQICLALNTNFPLEGGRRSCKRFDWWLHVRCKEISSQTVSKI